MIYTTPWMALLFILLQGFETSQTTYLLLRSSTILYLYFFHNRFMQVEINWIQLNWIYNDFECIHTWKCDLSSWIIFPFSSLKLSFHSFCWLSSFVLIPSRCFILSFNCEWVIIMKTMRYVMKETKILQKATWQ